MPLGTKLADRERNADGLPQEQIYALSSAVANLPHPHKESLGEDAFLLGPNMIGIADGVGSWWELDVDPAVYARALMQLARGSCVTFTEEQQCAPPPTEVASPCSPCHACCSSALAR